MTDSKAAMFTATPVTVPARCLRKKIKSPRRHSMSLYSFSQPQLLNTPVHLISFNPFPGLVHLNVLVAMSRYGKDTAQGIPDPGKGGGKYMGLSTSAVVVTV